MQVLPPRMDQDWPPAQAPPPPSNTTSQRANSPVSPRLVPEPTSPSLPPQLTPMLIQIPPSGSMTGPAANSFVFRTTPKTDSSLTALATSFHPVPSTSAWPTWPRLHTTDWEPTRPPPPSSPERLISSSPADLKSMQARNLMTVLPLPTSETATSPHPASSSTTLSPVSSAAAQMPKRPPTPLTSMRS